MSGLFPISLLIIGTFLRCFVAIEIPGFTRVISSWNTLNSVKNCLQVHLCKLPVYVWLIGLWGVISFLLFIHFLHSSISYFKKLDTLYSEDDETVLEIARKVSLEIGTSVPKIILLCADSPPIITGYFHPTIFIPEGCYTKNELVFVLRHELMHWKNNDRWIKLFTYLFCCVFWWNPLVYLLKTSLSDVLEFRCDISACSRYSELERKEYVRVLLKTLEYSSGSGISNNAESSMSESEKTLLNRIRVVLNKSKLKRAQRILSVIISLFIAILFVFSYSFVVQTAYVAPSEDINQEGFIEITNENAYIVQESSGEYWLYFLDKRYNPLDEEIAIMMIEQSGFNFICEERNG